MVSTLSVHVYGLRRRPVKVALAEGTELALGTFRDLPTLVALGVRVLALVDLAVAAVERVHAEAHEAVVATASVRHDLSLLGEVVLVELEIAFRVVVPALVAVLTLDAVDVVVAEAEELVLDYLLAIFLVVLLVLLVVVNRTLLNLLLGTTSASSSDSSVVLRAQQVQRAQRAKGGHLCLKLRHLVAELLLALLHLQSRLRLRQRQLVLLINSGDIRGVLLLEDLEFGLDRRSHGDNIRKGIWGCGRQ